MTKTIHTPHDAAFKNVLTQPETARDFLQLYLPPELLEICDLDTLTLESASFVEEDLRACYADVLWSLDTRQQQGYVYALIEHQSSPDRHMAFRLMRYAIAAMQRHLNAGHDQLPLVIPILFYHGDITPYPHPMSWLAQFADPALAKKLYSEDFPLVDITVIPDDEILQHRRMALLELLQKHIRHRDLTQLMEQLVNLLSSEYAGDEQARSLINYMLQAGNTTNPMAFIQELALRSPQHKEALMTIAEKLKMIGLEKGYQQGLESGIQQGLADGKQQGIEVGKQQGEQKARRELAHAMLASGLDAPTVSNITGFTSEELAQLVC